MLWKADSEMRKNCCLNVRGVSCTKKTQEKKMQEQASLCSLPSLLAEKNIPLFNQGRSARVYDMQDIASWYTGVLSDKEKQGLLRVSRKQDQLSPLLHVRLAKKGIAPMLYRQVWCPESKTQIQILQRISGSNLQQWKEKKMWNSENEKRICPVLIEKIEALHDMDLVHGDLLARNVVVDSKTLEPWLIDVGGVRFVLDPKDPSDQLHDVGWIRGQMRPHCEQELDFYAKRLQQRRGRGMSLAQM